MPQLDLNLFYLQFQLILLFFIWIYPSFLIKQFSMFFLIKKTISKLKNKFFLI